MINLLLFKILSINLDNIVNNYQKKISVLVFTIVLRRSLLQYRNNIKATTLFIKTAIKTDVIGNNKAQWII